MKKTIITFIFTLAAFVSAITSSAQETYVIGHVSELGQYPSMADAVAAIGAGKPDRIDLGDGNGVVTFEYGFGKVCFLGNEFYRFEVKDGGISMFEGLISGGLRVGDDLDRIFDIRNAYPKKIRDGEYQIFTKSDVSAGVLYSVKTKKITGVYLSVIL